MTNRSFVLKSAATGGVARATRQALAKVLVVLTAAPYLGLTACRAPEGQVAERPGVRAEAAERLREEVQEMIAAARDRVYPALVNIHVVTVNHWGGKQQKSESVGSGTIISAEGYVLTNQHVTAKGRRFRCTLADKREITAHLTGEDPLTDIAVLRLDPDEIGHGPLPQAEFGNSDELAVGDYVMAMGSPYSLSRSVTLGIVSNTERVFGGGPSDDEVMELELEYGQRTGLFTNWIQHDAAINPGNSGGPLVNLKGEVVGVNELGGDQLGFAIPSNLARQVAGALIQRGEVVRSEIGVNLKAIQRTGLEEGVLVNSVVKDGPADRAGLRAGDVIVRMFNEPVTVRFVEQVPPLAKRIADLPPGAELPVTYRRGEEEVATTVVTEKMQKDRGDETALRGWGFTAFEITPYMARERRLDSTAGVLISGVRPGGPAAVAEPPLVAGDVLRAIDQEPVENLAGFVETYRRIMARDPLPPLLLAEFDRQGQRQVTLIKPRPEKDIDPPREVRKAWLGVATQPMLRELARELGCEGRTGFRVTRVYPNTEAERAGLRVGDIIVGLGGEAFNLRGLQDAGLLARQVRRLDIDESTRLTILRGGKEEELDVRLEPTRLTVEEARRDQNRDFELTVREVTFFDRDENRWADDVDGVIVEQVEEAGWAGLGGIEVDDLIQQINGTPVRDLPGYRKLMEEITRAQPERVVMVVLRGVRTHFQFIEPEWNPVVRTDHPEER